jgi:hypothetical protein
MQRWKDKEVAVCSGGESRIWEHQLRQARHTGDDYSYSMANVVFSPQHETFALDCEPTDRLAVRGRPANKLVRQHQIVDWIRSLRQVPSLAAKPDAEWDSTPTLFVRRDCNAPYNPFHCAADLVNAFMITRMYDIKLTELRIFFLDDSPETILWAAWREIGRGGVYTKPQWKEAFGSGGDMALRKAILAIPSGSNMIWKDGWVLSPCPHASPVLRQFNHLAAHAYVDQAQQAVRKAPKIVFASRANARYRKITNEAEIAAALRVAFPGVEVVRVDLGTLSFEAQVQLTNSATLLMGMHGAAMAHILFISDPSQFAVLEMFASASDRPYLYTNQAKWVGVRDYAEWISPTSDDKNAAGTTIPEHDMIRLVGQLLHVVPQPHNKATL